MCNVKLSDTFFTDSAVDELLSWFNEKTGNENSSITCDDLKSELLTDPDDILKRQDTIKLLLENEQLSEDLHQLVSITEQIKELKTMLIDKDDNSVTASFMDLLLQSKQTVESLETSLKNVECKGLIYKIKLWTDCIISGNFLNFIKQWENTCCKIKSIPKSLKLHLELDELFTLKNIYIDSVSSDGEYKNSIISCENTYTKEVALEKLNVFTGKAYRFITVFSDRNLEEPYGNVNIFDRFLSERLNSVKSDIYSFLSHNFSDIIKILAEIKFILSCTAFCKNLKSTGLPCSFPEITPQKDKKFMSENAYSLVLANRFIKKGISLENIVTNKICFSKGNSALVITGANQGGKTTYLHSIVIIQFLSQLGVMVPSSYTQISPVNSICTVFAKDSKGSELSSEFASVMGMLDNIDEYSLVLLNEPFMCTTKDDGIYFCREVIFVLLSLGCKSVWVTHLFELADKTFFNFMGERNSIMSLIVKPMYPNGQYAPSYIVEESDTQSNSHAWDILNNI